jgi:hypothetical protein
VTHPSPFSGVGEGGGEGIGEGHSVGIGEGIGVGDPTVTVGGGVRVGHAVGVGEVGTTVGEGAGDCSMCMVGEGETAVGEDAGDCSMCLGRLYPLAWVLGTRKLANPQKESTLTNPTTKNPQQSNITVRLFSIYTSNTKLFQQ